MKAQRCGDSSWHLSVPADWPGFAGHFPGDPLLPGAELVAIAAACVSELGMPTEQLRSARFRAPVRPGDELRWEARVDERQVRLRALRGDELCAELIWAR